MQKICVITGSRAEYGLLFHVMQAIEQEPDWQLQVVVTGMHLSPEFGLTYAEIEKDGFNIADKVETQLSSDTPVGTAKSIGLGIIGFADSFARLQPDLIVVLGDRYEIFSAVQAALVAKIPIAHIAGGDVTEGAFDEAIRHSITKMSHLHFVTNDYSLQNVRQLGENPRHIFNVGHIGIDCINSLGRMSREELQRELSLEFYKKNLLITFHPVTLEKQSAKRQFNELLAALEWLDHDFGLIFTYPNADPEGREMIGQIKDFVSRHKNAMAFPSLGQLRYYSLIEQVDAVVGNSSSGVYEVPSFRKPTVNIGDRQKGRVFAASVICCPPRRVPIYDAIQTALTMNCSQSQNPYGTGGSVQKIVAILKTYSNFSDLIKKLFFKVTG